MKAPWNMQKIFEMQLLIELPRTFGSDAYMLLVIRLEAFFDGILAELICECNLD